MISLTEFLMVAALLFGIGLAGIILNRKNIIVLMMSIELILLSVNTNFIAFSYFFGNPIGEAFVFFVLTVATPVCLHQDIGSLFFWQKSIFP